MISLGIIQFMEPLLYILQENEDCLFALQSKLGPDVPSLVDDIFVYHSFYIALNVKRNT